MLQWSLILTMCCERQLAQSYFTKFINDEIGINVEQKRENDDNHQK